MLEISNFALEIFNISAMKRSFFLVLFGILLLCDGIYMVFSPLVIRSSWTDWLQGILLILVSGFALYQGASNLWSSLKGDPIKDELLKKIYRKASSQAFHISIWCWIVLMLANRHLSKPPADILQTGILIMGGVYIISIVVIKIRGLGDE